MIKIIFNLTSYKPHTGVGMLSPIPGIKAEIFLQHDDGLLNKHWNETKTANI